MNYILFSNNNILIPIRRTTYQELEKFRLLKDETLDDIIMRLINSAKIFSEMKVVEKVDDYEIS